MASEKNARDSQSISSALRVDFSEYENRDLITEGLEKMLSVWFDKCTLRQLMAAFLRQVQELYDVAIQVEKARTLYFAAGVNLDALGRIVGRSRTAIAYSEDSWFKWDTQGQSFDQMPWWVTGGYLNVNETATDGQYREQILARILKNHTLCASIPEILFVIREMFNLDVSYTKLGPMKVRLIVQNSISKVQLYLLMHKEDNMLVDSDYLLPYPATLAIDEGVWFVKKEGFYFDRPNPYQWDTANWAVVA